MNRNKFKYSRVKRLEKLIDEALSAMKEHKDKVKNDKYLVLIDMKAASYKKRFFIIDTKTKEVVRNHHVSHGVNSNKDGNKVFADKFSNRVMSKQSSLGSFVTGSTYVGKYGRSLNLHGLDKQNNMAFMRRIVIHKASYVTDAFILTRGRAGNSWGCPALDPAVCNDVINMIKEGVFLYAAY